MADEDGAHAQGEAEVHKDDEQRHGEDDLGYNDGHIEHIVDQFFAVEFILLQAKRPERTDDHRDDRGQHGDDKGVPEAPDERGGVVKPFQ